MSTVIKGAQHVGIENIVCMYLYNLSLKNCGLFSKFYDVPVASFNYLSPSLPPPRLLSLCLAVSVRCN